MANARTITVTLTAAQYSALAGAVAEREVSLEDQAGDRRATTERATLNRAWDRLRDAWDA